MYSETTHAVIRHAVDCRLVVDMNQVLAQMAHHLLDKLIGFLHQYLTISFVQMLCYAAWLRDITYKCANHWTVYELHVPCPCPNKS